MTQAATTSKPVAVHEKSDDSRRDVHPELQRLLDQPHVAGPRLPYPAAVEERFGVGRAEWKALVEAIFPMATSVDSVILALAYCKARKLDVFKRVVHIVPVWSSAAGKMIDTVWPGIGELRTTAFRTGAYAGKDAAEFGPDMKLELGGVHVTFPEWCRITVHRVVGGTRVAFTGPKVVWLETYATKKRDSDAPNEMWQTRPYGQIEKCAEAAALRAAFPEEIGNDYIPEEVQHVRHVRNEAESGVSGPSPLDEIKREAKASGVGAREPERPTDPKATTDPKAEPRQEPEASKPRPEPDRPKANGWAAPKAQPGVMSPNDIDDAMGGGGDAPPWA